MPYNDLRRGRRSIEGQTYLITAATHGRRAIFADLPAASMVARAISHTEGEGLWTMLAWVVMPDHVHVLVTLRHSSLATAMQALKGRSSRSLGHVLRLRGPIWQPGFHDRALRRDESLEAAARYVCTNPLRAGIVRSLREYPYWDTSLEGFREVMASG